MAAPSNGNTHNPASTKERFSIREYLGLWDYSPYEETTPEIYSLQTQLAEAAEDDPRAAFLLRCYLAFDVHAYTNENPLDDCAWFASTGENGSLFTFEAGETVARSLDQFEREITREHENETCLDLCALNVSSAVEQGLGLYRQQEQLAFVVKDVADRAAEAIIALFTRFLYEHWGMEHIQLLIEGALPDAGAHWRPSLPSKAKSASDSLGLPLHFDFTWRWLREAPKYKGDTDVYVWQPLNDLPCLDILRLVVSHVDGREDLRVLMLTSNKLVLRRLRAMYNSSDIPAARGTSDQLYCLLAATCGSIRNDVANFTADAAQQVLDVALYARRSASDSKIQYLCHLQECLKLVADYLATNISVVHKIQASLQANIDLPLEESRQRLYDAVQMLHECEMDFAYLGSELSKQREAMIITKQMTHEQMDIRERRRNRLIAFFVAVYVPLSFTATFLGMNIASTSGQAKEATQNQVVLNATSSLTGSNLLGNYNWPMWYFYALALPLTFGTIILPLIAGPTFRGVAQFSYRNRSWWRIIVAIIASFIGIGLSIAQRYSRPLIYALIPLVSIWAGIHMFLAIRLRRLAMGFFWLLLLAIFSVVTAAVPLERSTAHVVLWAVGVAVVVFVWASHPHWFYVNLKGYKRERQKARDPISVENFI